MYEEDNWEDVPSSDEKVAGAQETESETSESSETSAGNREFSPAQDPDGLHVPKDDRKAKNQPVPKKKISKWQFFVLGGMLVVAVAGGAAVMLLDKPHPVVMGLNTKNLPPTTGTQAGLAPLSQKAAVVVPENHTSSSGFASLNALAGAGASASATPIVTTAPVASVLSPVTTPVVVVATPGSAAVDATVSSSAIQDMRVTQLQDRLQKDAAEIAQIKATLAQEKQIADSKRTTISNIPPKVVTRTVIRYIRVPVTPARVVRQPYVAPSTTSEAFTPAHSATGSMDGWSLVGGNAHEAMLSGPGGQVQSVRVGDALANGAIVQKVGIGEVQTNEGVIQ